MSWGKTQRQQLIVSVRGDHICIFAYVCWKFLLHTFSHCIIWTPRSFEIFIHHETNCHDVANNTQEQPIKECKVLNLQNLLLDPTPCNTGFLIHHKTNCHDIANNSQEQPIKECKVLNFQNLLLDPTPCNTGFLIGAGSRVPAPVFFKQSTRLLKYEIFKKKIINLTKY